jgi:hypothetical protein
MSDNLEESLNEWLDDPVGAQAEVEREKIREMLDYIDMTNKAQTLDELKPIIIHILSRLS